MSRKHKNKIDVMEAKEILRGGYGLNVNVMNFYQFRISQEEHKNIFLIGTTRQVRWWFVKMGITKHYKK